MRAAAPLASRAILLALLLAGCGAGAETRSRLGPGPAEPALEARARSLLEQARLVEPRVTPLLRRLAANAGAELVGLDHRLKTLESTLRKMRLILAEDPTLDVEDVEIHDALRYTMRVDDEPSGHYVRTVVAVLDALEDVGHRVLLVKNYWPAGDSYSGVNTELSSPEGFPWELQFHTSDSYRVQRETRPLYEELRRRATPPGRKAELFDRMRSAWDLVPIPADVLEPRNLHENEEIRERPRP